MVSAKVTAPTFRNVVLRRRLLSLLDEMGDSSITWICSPAGSGKTTLLSSYLKERRISSLWYNVDETDADPTNFFYCMSEAARKLRKGRRRSLPLLTPECRPGMLAFARNFFESLFDRMTPPFALVLDNYQDAPLDSQFQDAIRAGLGLVPDGIRIFVASREDCPAPFVSLRIRNRLSSISWEEIRFDLEEVRAILTRRGKTSLPKEAICDIHSRTRGWVAGVILLSEQGSKDMARRSVFDYLALEVFKKLPEPMKIFLLKTSLLPSVSPAVAYRMTGMRNGEAILLDLRGRFFTECYGDEYVYHQLFREFLLSEMKKRSKTRLPSLVRKAGQALADSGRTEEGVRLLLDAGACKEALPLMLARAPELVKQGRSKVLEEWAQKLPPDVAVENPWLAHWLGLGRLVTDPASARVCFERAFAAFESAGDQSGCLMAAGNVINAIVLEWDDCRSLDPWVDWIDKNVGPFTRLPSPRVEAHVASAMVAALWRRHYRHPDMGIWIERTLQASEDVKDMLDRFRSRANVLDYYGVYGHFEEMRGVAREFRKAAFSSDLSPLAHLTYMVRLAHLYDWTNDSWKEIIELIRKAIGMAEDLGAYAHVGAICVVGTLAAFEMDDIGLVGDFIKRIGELAPAGKSQILARSSIRKAFYSFRKGALSEARYQAETGLDAALKTGIPQFEALARITLAYALRLMGETAGAYGQIERIKNIIGSAAAPDVLHYLVALTEASLAFDRNDRSEGLKMLGEAFRLGRKKGYAPTFYFWWQPAEMARLCGEAFSAGVEVEYAKEVERIHRLAPVGRPENLKHWPWPVRIYTFGRFKVEVNDSPLTFSHKAQKKPLALLKAIIVMGGRDVAEETLQDLLWPDAEGDAAHIAFKSAVFRLRRLLGDEKAVEIREGRASLNAKIVWLDMWAFESLSERVSRLHNRFETEKGSNGFKEISVLLLDLYNEDFLAGAEDPWIDDCRRRLRKRYGRILGMLTEMLNRAGEPDQALLLREISSAADRDGSL